MNIRFLETFIWLARLRNFRLTAEKLHTTQAAVSSRIASLEDSFDVRLFDRNSRSATLTPAGRKLLAYAERIVRLGDEMRREVDDASGDAGLIRIGVIESIVHSWFPALMRVVRDRYPRLEIEVTSDTTIHLEQLLRTDSVDLILQTDLLSGPEFVNHPLCEFPLRWVASPTLGLSGNTINLDRVAEFPVLSFSRHSGPHAALERVFADVERPARINCISSVAAMIRLVADGFGVAVLPPAIIQRELTEGVLELLDVDGGFAPLPLIATHRAQGGELSARIVELAAEQARVFVHALGPALVGTATAARPPRAASKRAAAAKPRQGKANAKAPAATAPRKRKP
ncbi:LysR family transcriptional regulator [Paraburkholderia acidicola]|uniref:LysR family transcriptional regulator n=1 Tax=Paraburkholderia acidicola TaxID=1912599 RepID=A0A2A4F5Y1_9BURK|nr:LysR family transcriptional regulator [Paraburkholderia acidicola]PCE28102.1 LysR family transcriptional regulator [Paraburkholderia acidicola]